MIEYQPHSHGHRTGLWWLDLVLVGSAIFVALELCSCGSSGSGTQPPPPPPAYSFAYLNHVGANQYQIKVMKTDGTAETSVGTPDNFTYLRLSPDGTKIVFSYLDSSNVYQVGLVNTDGSGRTTLTSLANSYPQYPQFTPDGTKIIYQWMHPGLDIVTINLDGSNLTYLTNGGGDHFWPTVSPDGKLVALTVGFPAYSLATMNIDGSGLTVIENGPDARNPTFSGDGKTIFFTNANATRDGFLFSINLDGSNLKQLTSSNYALCPLALGNMVLFESSATLQPIDNYQISTMAEDGSGLTQLTHDVVFDGFCPF